jgi:hypothetical protein
MLGEKLRPRQVLVGRRPEKSAFSFPGKKSPKAGAPNSQEKKGKQAETHSPFVPPAGGGTKEFLFSSGLCVNFRMKFSRIFPLLLIGFLSLSSASALTALQAKAVAEKQLSSQSKNRLIAIYGPRSATKLTPDVWKFVFLDPTASQRGRLITVSGSAVSEIRDGYFELDRLRLAAYKQEEVIDPARLKVDSNAAYDVVAKSAQLSSIKMSTVVFTLKKNGKGAAAPVWHLALFADKAGKEAAIGHARVSAETGRVLSMNLQLEKLTKK